MPNYSDNSDRASLIKVITSPLGFFALSLLIVEGFLTISLIFSKITDIAKLVGMLIGAGLFVLVVLLVYNLVKKYPENLTFGELSHIEKAKLAKNFGTSEAPVEKSAVQTINTTVPQ